LDYVIKGLDHKHLIVPCARAFNILCTENAKSLACFAENIVAQGIILFIIQYLSYSITKRKQMVYETRI
jgi:hypothetical protein